MCDNLLQKESKQNEQMQMEVRDVLQDSVEKQGIYESYHNASKEYIQDEKAQKDDKASKWESQEKKERRQERITRMKMEEDRKKEFFRPIDEMCDEMMNAMENVTEQGAEVTSMHFAQAFQDQMYSRAVDFTPENLVKSGANATEEFKGLCELFRQLSQYMAESFTAENAKKMLGEYQLFADRMNFQNTNRQQSRVLEAASKRYLYAKIQDDRAEEAVAHVDPQACYILLMNTISVELRNYVNYMGEENVNLEAFKTICGIADATTIAASYVLMHTDFIEEQNAYIVKTKEERTSVNQEELAKNEEEALNLFKELDAEGLEKSADEFTKKLEEEENRRLSEEERIRKEEEKKRLEEERKRKEEEYRRLEEERKRLEEERIRKERAMNERLSVLAKLVSQIAKDDIWPKEHLYALGKAMMTEDILTEQDTKGFITKANLFREKLQNGLGKVRNFLNANEQLYLNMGLLKEKLYEVVAVQMGNDLLEERSEEKEKLLLEEIKKHELVQKWTSRKASFMNGLKKYGVTYSEGELEELWHANDMQNLILTMEDETLFQKTVEELTKQAKVNSDIIIKLVEDNFFEINRERALKQIRKYMGSSWITGSPNVIYTEAMNFIADMNLLDAKLHHREAMLKNIVKEYNLEGFEKATAIAVRDNVSSELFALDEMGYKEEEYEEKEKQIQNEWKKLDTQEVKEKLAGIKQVKEKNETEFKNAVEHRTYQTQDWDAVYAWYKENIFVPSETFVARLTKMLNEKTEQYTGEQRTFAVSNDNYQKQVNSGNKKAFDTYKNRIAGEEFFTADEFAEIFGGRTEAVFVALNKLFSGQEWKNKYAENMPYIKKVDSVESLENLTYIEYQNVLNILKDNMRSCIDGWRSIYGPYSEEIQNELLTEIFLGTVNKENLAEKIKEAEERYTTEHAEGLFRFYAMLETGKDAVQENKFRQLKIRNDSKGKINWGIGGDISETRWKRFTDAKQVWNELYAAGLDTKMLLACNDILAQIEREWSDYEGKKNDREKRRFYREKCESFGKKVAKLKDSSMTQVFREEELNKVKEIFDKADIANEMQEFLMCSAENVIFRDKAAVNLFKPNKDDEHVYKNSLADFAFLAGKRSRDMSELLESIQQIPGYSKAWTQRLCELQIGLAEVTGTLEEQEKIKLKNKEQYGIESWEKACEEMRFMISVSSGAITQDKLQELEKREGGVRMFQIRKKQMEEYKGGILRPILPYLILQPEVVQICIKAEEAYFAQYMEALELSNVGKISKKIAESIPADLQGAFVLRFQEEFLSGKEIESYRLNDRINTCVSQHVNVFYEKHKSELQHIVKTNSIYPKNEEGCRDFIVRVIKNNPELRKPGVDSKTTIELLAAQHEIYRKNLEYAKKQITLSGISIEYQNKFLDENIEAMLFLSETEFKEVYREKLQPKYEEMYRQEMYMQGMNDILNEKSEEFFKEIQKGAAADADIREILNEARIKAWKNGSPFIASFDLEEKSITKEHYEAASEYIAARKIEEYPKAVLQCLMERHIVGQISGNKADHETLHQYKEKYDLIKSLGETLTETQIRECMIFSRHCEETDDVRMLEEYSYRRTQMEELEKAVYDDPMVQNEYRDFMESMAMGKFTMKNEVFRKVTENRKKYFQNLNAAVGLFDSNLKQYGIAETEFAKYKEILCAYFKKDIVNGTLEEQKIAAIITVWFLTPEFKAKLSEDILTKKEAGIKIFVEEKDVYDFLINEDYKNENVKKYAALGEEERKLFALALMLPGKIGVRDILPNADLLNGSEEQMLQAEDSLKEQVENYIDRKEFNPQIHYGKVLEKLRTPKNELDKDALELALAFVELCTSQREEKIPKDWEKIGNGITSIEAAKRIQGVKVDNKKSKMPEHVDGMGNFRELMERFFEEEAGKSKVASVKMRMDAMFKANKTHILIAALQNRSMLDYTTGTTFIDRANGKVHEFANEQLYQQSKEFWGGRTKEEEKRMMEKANTAEFCTRAMQMLFSYQLKDHVNLSDREITKEDFADGVLKRDSAIDWDLLNRALDFVDETDTEHLRIQAAHNAKNYIQYSTNQAAKEQSEKWKKRFKEEKAKAKKEQYGKETALKGNRTQFEKFLLENGSRKNKQVAALLSGYFCLTDSEKELFAKALQSRDILDVSKQNLYMNQFGLADREFVNVKGRDALMNEYVTATLSKDGRIQISEQVYGDAVQSLLSTQIDDSIDFSQYKDKNAEEFMANEHFYKKDRNTAVDWKLFRRALQFVQRCTNERQIYERDREVFLAGKQENPEAEFQFDNAFLRRNLHRSGNRVSRFIGKRLLSNVIDRFPVKYQRLALLVLPVQTANFLNGIEELQREEKLEDILEEMVDDLTEKISEKLQGEEESEEQEKESEEKTEEKQESEQSEEKKEEEKEDEDEDEDEDEEEEEEEKEKTIEEKLKTVERADFEEDPRLLHKESEQLNILKAVSQRINEFEDDKNQVKDFVESFQKYKGYIDTVEEHATDILENGVLTKAVEVGFSKIYDNAIVTQGITLAAGVTDGMLKNKVVSEVTKRVDKKTISEFSEKLSSAGETYTELKEVLDGGLENVQDALKVIESAVQCGRTLIDQSLNKQHLKLSGEEAKEARAEDTKLIENQKEVLTERQQQLLEEGREQNVKAGEIASDIRSRHITTEMITTVGDFVREEVVGKIAETVEAEYIENILKEAQEIVVFMRGIFIDKNMLNQYYNNSGEELEQLRTALMKADKEKYPTKENFGKLSDIEVIQIAKGFESQTELAGFVGMNLIQAILFSASEENPIQEAKIRAKAILVALDMKDVIGKRDSATALEVFKKLMKEEYR